MTYQQLQSWAMECARAFDNGIWHGHWHWPTNKATGRWEVLSADFWAYVIEHGNGRVNQLRLDLQRAELALQSAREALQSVKEEETQ